MGFFKKVFKGIGKVFKKIGKGIKKVAMKVGKFMNKIGIVGQIAMAFILPGIGAALMNGLGGAATSMIANTFGGITGAIVKGAGHVLNGAHKFVTFGKNVFNTVSQGVTKFVGEFGKTALNKIPGINIESASKNFFGKGGAWQTVQEDIVKNASKILNPFKSTLKITDSMNIDAVVNSTGISKARIQNMNISLDLDNLKVGDSLNFDAGSIGKPFTGDGLKKLTGLDLGGTTPKPTFLSNQDVNNITGMDLGGGNISHTPPALTDKYLEDAAINYGLDPTLGNVTPNKALQLIQDGVPIPKPQVSLLGPPASLKMETSFGQSLVDNVKNEFTERYPTATPVGSTLKAVADAQDVYTQFNPPEIDDRNYAAPMYSTSNSQDFDVQAQSAPRNFMAYSGGGQFGSTARVYDSILMSPVSTWSRDLASRYAA